MIRISNTYLTWDAVDKRLRQFWQESYPREKIVKIKQTKKDLEVGTEKVYDHLVSHQHVSYQHVYYYGDVTVTKPNGAKYLYPLRIAFYQVTGQPQWNFHYASPGSPTVLEEAKGEDPMKISPEKARDLFKEYVALMMQKFPTDKWKDYCKANGVDIKITQVDFNDLESDLSVFNNIRYEDPDASFRIGFLVEGQYKDNVGSFNFRLKSVYANFYMNLKDGYWTISGSRDLRPIEKTELKDCRDLNDKLFNSQQEPRKELEQYITES